MKPFGTVAGRKPGFVTLTVTGPGVVTAGVRARIVVASTGVTFAGRPSIETVVTSVKLRPRIVTVVPPAVGPCVGETLLTCGVRSGAVGAPIVPVHGTPAEPWPP